MAKILWRTPVRLFSLLRNVRHLVYRRKMSTANATSSAANTQETFRVSGASATESGKAEIGSVSKVDASLPSASRQLRTVYPPIRPFDSGRLRVSKVHELYYEQVGNPSGKPIVFLHGGPGGGCPESYRQFFDPSIWRVVLFDQRGAGRSTPTACLEENTTWDLVADIEKLRTHLGIERWVVFGGSWGSTLALAYGETHPDRVKAMVLRGIFACRSAELLWFYQEGANWLFPDAWEKFIEPIPTVERSHLMSAYHRRLTGPNEAEKLRCALAWSKWEMNTSRLYVDPVTLAKAEEPQFALAFSRIECHYFVNGAFLQSDSQLIDNARILEAKRIPAVVVQGRYDLVCPMKSAWDLCRVWPSAALQIVPDAGHSIREPGITDLLIRGVESFAHL